MEPTRAPGKSRPTWIWEFRLHYVTLDKWNISHHERATGNDIGGARQCRWLLVHRRRQDERRRPLPQTGSAAERGLRLACRGTSMAHRCVRRRRQKDHQLQQYGIGRRRFTPAALATPLERARPETASLNRSARVCCARLLRAPATRACYARLLRAPAARA